MRNSCGSINGLRSSDQMRYNVVCDCLMVLLIKVAGDAKRRAGKLHARQEILKAEGEGIRFNLYWEGAWLSALEGAFSSGPC